jgi:hypothetical protein
MQRKVSDEEEGAMQMTFAVKGGDVRPAAVDAIRRVVESETAGALAHLYPKTAQVAPVCSQLFISEVS